jgi:hypothetical protein
MTIGVDFDNTIVSYDALFHRVARELGLIPAALPATKTAVRDHLRAAGMEDRWTALQGRVYGARMAEAAPYPGAIEFFQECRRSGIAIRIISHKTRHPFVGEKYDLRRAATEWLESNGFFSPGPGGLARADVFFEPTKTAKIRRIAECGCESFIDDLPEILENPSFPAGVGRVLFDPAQTHAAGSGIARFRAWSDLTAHFTGRASAKPAPGSSFLDGLSRLAPMLPAETEGPPELLAGGANNRVYVLRGAKRDRFLLKEYYSNPADTRNRYRSERDFYLYAWDTAGARCLPRPLAWDDESGLGAFEFVDGARLRAGEIDRLCVDRAMDFFEILNRARSTPEGRRLGHGAEACFTIEDHFATVQTRVDLLGRLSQGTPSDAAASAFVADELTPAWNFARATAERPRDEGGAGDGSDAWLGRCLSPSDFGFHNCLWRTGGALVFFDFEYAGWDDPVKFVCDFFCQPEIPVPMEHFEHAVERVAESLGIGPPDELAARCRALLPVYRIKWCCIMLNEFTTLHQRRRGFALGAGAAEARKEGQLSKARAALEIFRAPAGA